MADCLTEQYPPLPLKEIVERIRAFQSSTPSEKRAFIQALVDVHPSLNFASSGGWRFRRARIVSEADDVPHVSGLLWPPKGTSGRLSTGEAQVFYVADRLSTALCENDCVDSQVVISEFVIREGRSPRVCPIGELAQITRSGRGFVIPSSDALHGIINACPRDQATSLVIADSFLFDQLAGQDDYEISSAVAGALFAKYPDITVIAYPSRKRPGSLNYGVRVEGFWESWAMFSARRGRAEHLAQGFHKMSQITHVDGIYDNGALTWSSPPEDVESALQLDPPYTPPAFR